MSRYNKKKSDQLGVPIGTATSKLRKIVIFNLLCNHGTVTGYRYGCRCG